MKGLGFEIYRHTQYMSLSAQGNSEHKRGND